MPGSGASFVEYPGGTLHRDEIVPGFFRVLTRFGFEDFFSQERRDEPHRLQATANADKNWHRRLFSVADDVLKNAYQDSNAHMYCSLWDSVTNPLPRVRPYEYATLFPEVEEIISAHGPETKAAFETLFRLCKKYVKSVYEVRTEYGGVTVSFEKNGLTDEEGAQLSKALELIWKACPETDPRILEGHDYTMSVSPLVRELFPHHSDFGNRNRSDFRIEDRIAKKPCPDDFNHAVEPAKAVAIARQTAENYAALKPYGAEIARMNLAWYLDKIFVLDKARSRYLAGHIIERLAEGENLVAMSDILRGLAPLRGKREWFKNDEARTEAFEIADGAFDFLTFTMDVHNGSWFDRQAKKLQWLAKRAEVPQPGIMEVVL